MAPRSSIRSRGLSAVGAALVLVGCLASPVLAIKPPAPTTVTTIVSIDEETCEIVARFDWSGFPGNRLLAEIVIYEREAGGVDRAMLGADQFIVSGKQGSFTAHLYGLIPHAEAERPLTAKSSLWTYSNNTKMIVGSDSVSGEVLSACQG